MHSTSSRRRHSLSASSAHRETAQQLFQRISATPVTLTPRDLNAVIGSRLSDGPVSAALSPRGLSASDLLIVRCPAKPHWDRNDQQWAHKVAARHLVEGGHVVLISTPASCGFSKAMLVEQEPSLESSARWFHQLTMRRLDDWQDFDKLCSQISLCEGCHSGSSTRTEGRENCQTREVVPLVVVDLHTMYLQQYERFTAKTVPLLETVLSFQFRLKSALIVLEETLHPPPEFANIPSLLNLRKAVKYSRVETHVTSNERVELPPQNMDLSHLNWGSVSDLLSRLLTFTRSSPDGVVAAGRGHTDEVIRPHPTLDPRGLGLWLLLLETHWTTSTCEMEAPNAVISVPVTTGAVFQLALRETAADGASKPCRGAHYGSRDGAKLYCTQCAPCPSILSS